jgi:hypothetical protein
VTCDLEFNPVPDETSPHPWCFERPDRNRIRLGPGTVEIAETRVFDRHEPVEIAAGTTLLMGADASLVFLGPVVARGRRDAPIRFQSRSGRWGGIALQGHGTAGSRLSHVIVEHGTLPSYGIVHYPGMINLQDTEGIEISNALIRDNSKSDDALHAAYVRDLTIRETTVEDVASDAIDLEFTTGLLDDIVVRRAGDDAVDLMTSEVTVQNGRFVRFGDNAISAGEWTDATVKNCLAAAGAQGVLVKNASSVSLSDVLLYRNDVGVQLEPVSQWYTGKSHVRAEVLHAVQCQEQVAARGRKLKKLGRIESQVSEGELEGLRRRLGIGAWNELDAAVTRLGRAER